ncbi:hypothetical protein [Nonomuraea sp. NPDC003804]|uniref:hypothetical protein n=1 Tax=Nonomuraea sp. NPDC003804 TaxID=3154547 RepID=UPI0033B90FCB
MRRRLGRVTRPLLLDELGAAPIPPDQALNRGKSLDRTARPRGSSTGRRRPLGLAVRGDPVLLAPAERLR